MIKDRSAKRADPEQASSVATSECAPLPKRFRHWAEADHTDSILWTERPKSMLRLNVKSQCQQPMLRVNANRLLA